MTSSSSVRLAKVSITVSVTADSSIRRTGVLTPTVPQTSTAILPKMKTDGYTPHGLTTQPLTQVRFTLMVNLTGRVQSVLLREVVQSSLVDVTVEKPVTEALLMRSLFGTLLFSQETLLTLLLDKLLQLLRTQTMTDFQMLGRTSTQVTSLISTEPLEDLMALAITMH